jgi:hypothetical protein
VEAVLVLLLSANVVTAVTPMIPVAEAIEAVVITPVLLMLVVILVMEETPMWPKEQWIKLPSNHLTSNNRTKVT